MKENFIELTQDKKQVLVNLDNIVEIVPHKDYTSLLTTSTNYAVINVKETYEEIKTLIGRGTPDFKYREV